MDSNVKHSDQQSPQICVNDKEECHSRKRRSVRPPQKLRDYITNDDDPVIPDSNRNVKPIHKKELMRKQTSPKKVCKEVWLLDLLPYATYEYPSKVSKTNCPEKRIYIKEEPLDLDESEPSPDDNSFCDYNVRDTYIKLEPESVIENSTSERIQMEDTESYETEELAPHGNVTPSVEQISKTPPQLKPKSRSSNKRRNNKSLVTNELSVKDSMSVAKGNIPQSDANMLVTSNNRDRSGSVSKADYPPVKFRNSKTTGIDRRNKNYFHCYHCDYSTLSKSHLRIHVESVHLTLKQFCCPICPYRANQRAHLRQHVKAVHTKERPYPCNLCDYRATQKGHLRLHIDTVHEKFRPFGCNFCNFRSSLRCDLNRHVDDVHKKVKRFSCDICDYKCNRLRDIKKHMFRHEAVAPLQQNEKNTQVKGLTKHSCNHCSFQTIYKNSLTCHIQSIHKNIKPYNCELCEYKSSYRSALKMHVKSIHFGLKPFSCHLCGYKASLKYTIKMHILNVHKRVKPFCCHYCSYSVCKKHYLTKHIFSLHENDMLA